MGYLVSTDKSMLDINVIHDFLCNRSYWARGRCVEDVKATIDNSICFGAYDINGKNIGFSRVITDKVTFAYLLDTFVLEPYRGKGIGKMLIHDVMQHPDVQTNILMLGTADAHGLYEQYGFKILDTIGRYMIIRKNPLSLPDKSN